MGSSRTERHGRVALDEGNLNKQCLEFAEYVRWPKIINVTQNRSFLTCGAYNLVVLIIQFLWYI